MSFNLSSGKLFLTFAASGFIARQIFYDYHEIPFKFINKKILSEILEIIKGRIIFMSDKTPIFLAREKFYNVDNLPSSVKSKGLKLFYRDL